MRSFSILGIVLLAGLCACSKKTPAEGAKAQTAAASLGGQGDGNGKGAPPDGVHGTRKMKGIDVPVFLDGSEIAVLRYGEMPAVDNVGTPHSEAFRVSDYLRGIGVAPETVKSVYFYDGTNRIGSIEGSELAQGRDRFKFHFASGDAGNAETLWDTVGLKNAFIVHEIRKMVIFVAKAPPAIDKKLQCIVAQDGHCSEDVPYAPSPELAKGTRIYLDGKMVGFVKRRMLSNATIVGKTSTGDDQYSLAKFMSSLGIDNAKVQSVDLVAGDDIVARADASEWTKDGASVTFTLQKHEHGKGHMHVPAAMQAKGASADKDAMATAVLVHVTSPASHRDVVAISDETEMSAKLASNESTDEAAGIGSGSGSN